MTTKYQPTIYIDNEKYIKILAGELKLQCGQWIQLAWCDKPSRWVGLTKAKSVWAVHYPINMSQFKSMCKSI